MPFCCSFKFSMPLVANSSLSEFSLFFEYALFCYMLSLVAQNLESFSSLDYSGRSKAKGSREIHELVFYS